MNKIEAINVDFHYGDFHALKHVNIAIPNNEVVAFIGPSGCGKSTSAPVQPHERSDSGNTAHRRNPD